MNQKLSIESNPSSAISPTQWEAIKKIVGGDPSCLILIACEQSENGETMPVEMMVEGDKDLAQFILFQAQDYVENMQEET